MYFWNCPKDTVIHAYLIKDGSYNASMTAGGYAFVNIGLFAYINNEASLAAVLAHELAHYSRQHSLETFIREEKGSISIGLFDTGKKRLHFSVIQEQEADSLAMIWLHNAGYNVSGILDGFKIIQRIEKKMK